MHTNNKIPKVFHFVFGLRPQREPFHLAFFLCLNSCRQVNTPDKIYFYYHHEPHGHYWELIKPHLSLVHVPLVSGLEEHYGDNNSCAQYSYAHHADFIRVEKAMETGGVYADMDTLFINPIPEHLYNEPFVMGQEPDVFCAKRNKTRPSLCNAFFMTQKNALFAKEWLQKMPHYFDGTWSNHSCYLPYELSTEIPNEIHIEPQDRFFSVIWSKQSLYDFFESDQLLPDTACSVHLWNHLWWSKSRTDFSQFHNLLITEKNIDTVDTTFNRLARPYLPEVRSTLRQQKSYLLRLYYWHLYDRAKHLISSIINLPMRLVKR